MVRAPFRNQFLAGLTDEDRQFLVAKSALVRLESRTVLINAHEPIDHVYFIEVGIVSAFCGIAPRQVAVAVIGYDGVVGLPVALDAECSTLTFQVQVPAQALKISAQELRLAIRTRPALLQPIRLYALAFIAQVSETAYAAAAHSVVARLARLLLMVHDRVEGEEMSLTHETLAATLNVRRPSVTNAMTSLEEAGATRGMRGRIIVRCRDTLRRLAGDSYGDRASESGRLLLEASRGLHSAFISA